jgi:hypothetical protein
VSSPNAGTSYNWLESVTCTSGSECWAVGSYIGAGNKTLIQRWDGSAWSITSSPNASCIYDSSLRGITCASASACFAVGYYWDNQAGNDTLIERWDGNAWSIVASPNNGSAENNPINNNFLADVACGAATDCVAVGQRSALNSNGKVVTQTLSEHYSVPPVTPTSIVSRKADGSVGTYDIDLRNNPIECRSGGANGDYTIVFNFADALTNVGAASLTSGTGSISNAAIGADPHEYVVDLTGVANAQTITVSLANVNDSVGNSSASVSGTMRVLVGDTTNDGVVNSADIGQTKSQSGQSVSASNFREDVTADGSINSTDISLVKSKSGTALP